jgi:hypothetical protein
MITDIRKNCALTPVFCFPAMRASEALLQQSTDAGVDAVREEPCTVAQASATAPALLYLPR